MKLVKSVRQLKHMTRFLLSPSERMLLRFQKRNVIEIDTSSADSDIQELDPANHLAGNDKFNKDKQ